MIPIALDKLTDMAARLGVIDAVKRKLVRQPDAAAAQLVTVLDELSKIYGALDDELTTYVALFFDDSDGKQLARERTSLARLEGGAIRARMEEARGRCNKIWNLYLRYLTPWFDRVLNPAEREQLLMLFRQLDELDSDMVDAINALAAWISEQAKAVGDLVEAGDFAGANAFVLSARRQASPLRQRIVEAMIQIRTLEGAFIELSGAV